jgi:tryptophan synthase alpha chain
VDLALELEKAGADLIELASPSPNPLADGIVNQLGCQRALESGTTIPGVFDAVRTIREKSEIPIVFFTYYNPVYSYGLQRFLEKRPQPVRTAPSFWISPRRGRPRMAGFP